MRAIPKLMLIEYAAMMYELYIFHSFNFLDIEFMFSIYDNKPCEP